jgi:hypothetical protein
MIWAIDQDDDDNTMMSVVNQADLCKITDPSKASKLFSQMF